MVEKTEKKRSFYSEYVNKVAKLFIDKMKEGQIPWQMGWESYSMWPQSAVTKKPYRGMNAILLILLQSNYNYKDPRWITSKQAEKLGGRVKEGESGVTCIYWSKVVRLAMPEKVGNTGKDDKGGKQNKVLKEKDLISYGMIPCPFVVFNVEQCEGLNLEKFAAKKHHWVPVERAERLVLATGAVITHEISPEAYYEPVMDEIHLPLKEQFFSSEHYYDTLLHEISHWTGHPERLNRPMKGRFGSQEYAKEELRAEIASAMLGATIGIPHDMGNHVAYVQSWIDVLENNPKEIFRAASDAEKIKDFIISKDPELVELYGKLRKTKTKQEGMKNPSG